MFRQIDFDHASAERDGQRRELYFFRPVEGVAGGHFGVGEDDAARFGGGSAGQTDRAVSGESCEGLVRVTARVPFLSEAEPERPGIFAVPLLAAP